MVAPKLQVNCLYTISILLILFYFVYFVIIVYAYTTIWDRTMFYTHVVYWIIVQFSTAIYIYSSFNGYLVSQILMQLLLNNGDIVIDVL